MLVLRGVLDCQRRVSLYAKFSRVESSQGVKSIVAFVRFSCKGTIDR